MAAQVNWRYSRILDGKPQVLDVSMDAGLLFPKEPSQLMRYPTKITDPEPILQQDLKSLPEGAIIATKEDAGGDKIFHFTSVMAKPPSTVRRSIPKENHRSEGILTEDEEYLRDQAVQRYKGEFRLVSEAQSLVLDALQKDTREEMIDGLRKVPRGEYDNLELLRTVLKSMRTLDSARQGEGKRFLKELMSASERVVRGR